MRKSSIVREPNQQEKLHLCAYCQQIAELMCGQCEETFYCKPDHQRAHWKHHKSVCKSLIERRKDHLETKRMRKCQIFQNIAKPVISKAIDLIKKLIEAQKSFMEKIGSDVQMQIQLGSTVTTHIRLLIASKQFSAAQDLFSDYLKQKKPFLSDISNISSQELLQQMDVQQRQKAIYLISGKLRLISTLANLMHELIRNSIDMFGILIGHIEKVYGSDSLELSNVYFYTANYLNFLNQNNKALACFLKAAKLRKQKGGTAYYNVALLLLKSGRKKKSLQFFQKALELIEDQNNTLNSWVIPEIYENIALNYMDQGHLRPMLDYFQKAYFYYYRHQNKPKAQMLMKLFILLRKDGKGEGVDDIKIFDFAKERKDKKPSTNLSSKNYENYKNADKISEEDQRKTLQWLTSFKDHKMNNNLISQVKFPKQLEYLIGTENSKNGEQEAPSYLVNSSDSLGLGEGVNMDLAYMRGMASNQVGYLHELNRLLMECKQRAAIYDIVQNSNFYQAVSRDKIKRFYKLNPQLVRPTDINQRIQLMQKIDEEEQQLFENEVIQQKKVVTPKLDLTKIKPFRN